MPAPAEAPTTLPPLRPRRSSALAGRSRASGTVSGTRAAAAGRLTAATAPFSTLSTTSSGIVADPVTTSEATTAWVPAAASDVPTSTTSRRSRSAITPPKSSTATLAIDRAATTRPRSAADPVRSSTANARAIGATALPSTPVVRAASSQRNGRGPERTEPVDRGGHGRFIGNRAAVIDTGFVPGVRGGRAAACRMAEA